MEWNKFFFSVHFLAWLLDKNRRDFFLFANWWGSEMFINTFIRTFPALNGNLLHGRKRKSTKKSNNWRILNTYSEANVHINVSINFMKTVKKCTTILTIMKNHVQLSKRFLTVKITCIFFNTKNVMRLTTFYFQTFHILT